MTAASCFFYPSNFKLSYVIKWNVFLLKLAVYTLYLYYFGHASISMQCRHDALPVPKELHELTEIL